MSMWGSGRALRCAAIGVAMAATAALLPAAAQAWEVQISITGAGQVEETTPADLVGADCKSSPTTPTGSVGVTCAPGDPNGPYGHGWEVDYLATPMPGYTFARWESDGRTTPTPITCDRSDPPATSTTYTGTACKFRTFANLQTRAVFVDNTSPAMSSLSGPATPVNGPATFYFSASADPTFRYFECRVGGVHEWQTCSSGHTEDPPHGSYTFEVRAVDWSSNRSSIQGWNWTVDKVTPQTTLDSGVGPAEGSVTSATGAAFQFSTNESGAFECTLDGDAIVPCPSPLSLTDVGEGPHTFAVWAVDAAGNPDPTPAERHWTVDSVAPQTTIQDHPKAVSTKRWARFTFGSSEASATFRCSLDGGRFKPCPSPFSRRMGFGRHTLDVKATDQVGNEDSSPARWSWRVKRP